MCETLKTLKSQWHPKKYRITINVIHHDFTVR